MKSVKKDFPIFSRKINNKKLVYLDSSSTTQKPKTVINAIKDFYENNNANINRGVHTLGNEGTELFENTRKKVASFINTNEKELVTLSHYYGVPILVDAAQSAPHIKIDVKDLDCDFLAFSAHKMLGPAGIGVLYGKKKLLDSMEIIFGGGEMILEADYNNFIPRESPYKFEAGTPNIADVVAFSEAVKYLEKIGMDKIEKYEKELTDYAYLKLSKIKNIKIYGSNIKNRSSLISFNYFDNSERLIHPHDIATIMDEEGIALRAGHHCVMPLHKKLNIPASIRISFYIYNSKADINKFIRVLDKVNKIFNKK